MSRESRVQQKEMMVMVVTMMIMVTAASHIPVKRGEKRRIQDSREQPSYVWRKWTLDPMWKRSVASSSGVEDSDVDSMDLAKESQTFAFGAIGTIVMVPSSVAGAGKRWTRRSRQ